MPTLTYLELKSTSILNIQHVFHQMLLSYIDHLTDPINLYAKHMLFNINLYTIFNIY